LRYGVEESWAYNSSADIADGEHVMDGPEAEKEEGRPDGAGVEAAVKADPAVDSLVRSLSNFSLRDENKTANSANIPPIGEPHTDRSSSNSPPRLARIPTIPPDNVGPDGTLQRLQEFKRGVVNLFSIFESSIGQSK
jgi:hypothetical protein